MNVNKEFAPMIAIVIAVVIIAGGIGGYLYVKNKNKILIANPLNNSTLTKQNILASSTDETAHWKTYSNSRYDYTIKYPLNWRIDTTHSENDFTQRGGVLMGGDTDFSNCPEPTKYTTENPPGCYDLHLTVYKIDPAISYDQFLASQNYGVSAKENVLINGINAVRLTGVTEDAPVGVTVINTFIKVDGKMFWFSYSDKPISQAERDIMGKIIGSFSPK